MFKEVIGELNGMKVNIHVKDEATPRFLSPKALCSRGLCRSDRGQDDPGGSRCVFQMDRSENGIFSNNASYNRTCVGCTFQCL